MVSTTTRSVKKKLCVDPDGHAHLLTPLPQDMLNTEEGVVIQAIDGSLAQQIRVPAYKSADFTSAFADQVRLDWIIGRG